MFWGLLGRGGAVRDARYSRSFFLRVLCSRILFVSGEEHTK